MFPRLNALSTPFYTLNVAHANFIFETIPAIRKTQSFVAFDENSVITFLMEIFRRLNAHYTPFYLAERSARQFQRQDSSCKSQNAIFQISTTTLLFPS
jgi:hypothetical protein